LLSERLSRPIILPVGIRRCRRRGAPPAPGRTADRLDLAPMDLPAHHPERPARGDDAAASPSAERAAR